MSENKTQHKKSTISIKQLAVSAIAIALATVTSYLKMGKQLNLCPTYDRVESRKRCNELLKQPRRKRKQFKMIENNEVVL